MDDSTLADIESALERASELESEAAVELLASAHDDLEALADDPAVDQQRRRDLETRLEQRVREVRNRDAYDGGLGSAMNPDDDDAP